MIEIKPIELITKKDKNKQQHQEADRKTLLQNDVRTYERQISDLKKRKELLRQEIKHEIAQEKEQWEHEKKALMKEAHDKGYEDGFNIGKQESLNKYNALIDQANELIEQATKDYHATIEKSEEMIVDLAIHTAERIMQQKITDDPKNFLPIVSSAIHEIKDQSTISIYLHPNNYEVVLQQKAELADLLDGDTKLSIYINQHLKENDCMIEHPFGQIDASVDTQLIQIRKALQEFVMEKKQ